jgi:hypothetical protein
MSFFAGALALGKTFFGSSVGKMVGTAVINRALQPKPQPAVLRYATQTETNDANLEVMRQKAEEAGFNPLTVLRAGGINAYSTRTTNIPSYAPQLSKGPSYLSIAAGAAAKSYFNRPTEEQKASQALKIAQQYADLDYTRAMTTSARNAGSDVAMTPDELLLAAANRPVTDGSLDDWGRPILIPPTERIMKWRGVKDQTTGKVVYIVDPELTESGPQEMTTGLATLKAATIAADKGIYPEFESVYPPLASIKNRWPMKIQEFNRYMDEFQ